MSSQAKKIEDYSDNPNTIKTRRFYHSRTKVEKRKLFKKIEKRQKKLIADGKCPKCGKPRERQEIKHCNSCHRKSIDRVKEYTINNALDNKCRNCPNDADGNSSHCKVCKEKARLRMRAKRESKNVRNDQECK